ncbi:MAG: oxidoreductase [Bacteroidota bacterium]
MKRVLFFLGVVVILMACSNQETSHNFSSVGIKTVFEDSVSIRAITFLDGNTLAFAGSGGIYGTVDIRLGKVRTNIQNYDSITPEFRAVAHTKTDFFMLSAGSPALLYKTGAEGKMELVYQEEGQGVFYDAMKFWNDKEGIAIGDFNSGCFAIIATRDGGKSWNRLPCEFIPELEENTGAYAASNTNIAIIDDKAWVMTSKEQVLFTADKGRTWEVIEAPIQIQERYQGIYSIDFYDAMNGFGIGGDFSKPELKDSNKMKTVDGGKTWSLVADGNPPGYKSCVRYVPNAGAQDLVAVGFTGITYSKDSGTTWEPLSEEGFYTLHFLNDSVAYAAGKHRIARLLFK